MSRASSSPAPLWSDASASSGPRPPADRLGDFTADRRMLLLAAIGSFLGAISAFVAYALLWLINVITNLAYYGRLSSAQASPARTHLGAWAVLLPVAGALVIGLMARYGSEKVRGHGIPEAMEAILIGQSKIEPKVAILKPLSSAISIGTGGPFGAEGPIIVTGGAVGSMVGQLLHISAAERKTLLVAGAAAGMTATFGTPIAAVLIAVELLLFEWKPRSFVPVALACATAAAIRPVLFGAGALFPVRAHADLPPADLVGALALGVLVGFGSGGLTALVYACEDLFGRLRLHWMWWPAIGGLGIGIGGLIEPRALGVGYQNIRVLLDGRFATTALLSLLIVKAIIWSFSLGSGTSGGVLAPLLIMGGALGGLAARATGATDIGLWAMLGMAAMIGGTMRAPLTAMVFTLELTRDLNALLPLLIACSAAFAVTVLLMRRSILTEKVARRGHHVVREYAVDPLELTPTGQVMRRDVATLGVRSTVAEALTLFADASGDRQAHGGYPVVEDDRRVVGMVTRADVLAIDGDPSRVLVQEVMSSPPIVGRPEEPLARVAERMALASIGRIPVVREDRTLAGIVSRRDLLRARADATRSEARRERVILPSPRRRRRSSSP